MLKKDYYDLLGLDRTASREEIKKAYRRLAHQCHPDKNPQDPAAAEQFREITEAYEVLLDVERRAAYDRRRPSAGGGFDSFHDAEEFFSQGRSFFDDVLEDFLGARRRRPRRTKGADLRYNLEISLEEAASGAAKEIRFPRVATCPVCRGTRCAPGTAPVLCPLCRGSGSLRAQRGFFILESACGRCGGEGRVILRPCTKCGGLGRVKITRILRIQVPRGVDNASRLRIGGEGEIGGNGGPPGDFYIVISVKKHPLFVRQGNDLLVEVFITFAEAVMGTEIEVPTFTGKARLKTPAGIPSGKVFTLKGQGMPVLMEAESGDLKVTVRIEVPESRRQQALLEEFNRLAAQGKKINAERFMEEIRRN